MTNKLPSFSELNPVAVILLADGRPILMQRLVQSQTYGGLLVGLPNERVNKGILEEVGTRACGEFGESPEPYVIQPVFLPFTTRTQKRTLTKAGLGPGEGEIEDVTDYRLPLVECMASFRCPQTIGEPNPDDIGIFAHSVATIVWFQDRYAMPIAREVLDEIKLIDWKRIAVDTSD